MWLLFLPLVIPAMAGVAARPLAARMEPRQATWLLTGTAVALAACSTAALALLVAFAAVRAPVLAEIGDYSQHVVRRLDSISGVAGMIAGTALAGAVAAVAVIFRNRARALAASYRHAASLGFASLGFASLGFDSLGFDDCIVVVPGPALDAYALPGRPGRIVVSGHLLERLDTDSQAVLIAHEQAHLAGRHHIFAAVARLAAAANPMLLPVARSVEYTLERWADEHAARVTGDRRLVAETVGQVALLASPRRGRIPSVTLGITGRARDLSLSWAGPVPRRVAALLAAPPRRRLVLLAAAAVVVMLAGLAALDTATDLHALLELAQAGA